MHRRFLIVVAFVAAGIGCQTINEEMPTGSSTTPTPAAAIPVVIVDVTPPAPTPAPTPTPLPTPSPGPGPVPTPTPGARACTLPPGGGNGHTCPREQPAFLAVIEEALDKLVREEPSLFDLNKTKGCGNCYYVRDATRYLNRLTEAVRSLGYCATFDRDEVAIKNVNRFNEQFDVLTSDGFVRRQLGSYRATCYPAWF
jgi:hypothetical protein